MFEANLPAKVRCHLDNYWFLTRHFFKDAQYPIAAFFAITLIEEVGKIIILGNRDLGGKLDRKSFYDHKRKYAYAVGMTLKVNSRVARLYEGHQGTFVNWFDEGRLFDVRNAALYLAVDENSIQVPNESLSPSKAFLLVCVAGEIYAEIQGAYTGTDANAWKKVLDEVDEFREGYSGKKEKT